MVETVYDVNVLMQICCCNNHKGLVWQSVYCGGPQCWESWGNIQDHEISGAVPSVTVRRKGFNFHL